VPHVGLGTYQNIAARHPISDHLIWNSCLLHI